MKHTLLLAAAGIMLLCSVHESRSTGIGRLYARYPNWEESPIFNLRIKTLHATVTVRDQLAVTHLDQEFANDNWARLEGFYVFQLPQGANVNEMALWINGVRVPYVIKKREEAVVIYNEIVRRMTDPAILEQLGKNQFRLRIFPIEPYSSRRIEIQYLQFLPLNEGTIKYEFPLDMSDYTASPIEQVSVSIDLLSEFEISSLSTSVDQYPTAAVITPYSDRHYSIVYGVENVSFARDFALRFAVARGDKHMQVLTYTAPDSLHENPYYILWVTLPDALPGGQQLQGRELTFVADVSSSMEGVRLQQLKEALRAFVDSLTTQDKFTIIAFSTGVIQFQDTLVFATPEQKVEAGHFIDRLAAIGLTNVDAALRQAVAKVYSDSLKSAIVFLTDGEPTWGETHADSILTHINHENTKGVRIFPVGIGDDLDVTLLEQIAQQTGGTLTLVSSEDSIALTTRTLVIRLFSPALTNSTIDYSELFPFDVYPPSIPTAFGGEQIIQTGRFEQAGPAMTRLTGSVGDQPFELHDSLTFADTSKSLISVSRYWGAQKILYLLDLIKQLGEVGELVDQVVALSIRYGVLTPYTAFLVVEPGQGTVISVEDEETSVTEFTLLQNYPNPFNPSTMIRYAVPGSGGGEPVLVRLVICDILGREVRTLVAEMQSPGMYSVVWDGTGNSGIRVSSGIYIYRLTAGSYSSSKRMVLMK